ncbi:cysteine desulfurase IscS [Candidatus Phycosocius bacilliformis]|uniref:Cysteine desulfurase n=1 Tax=Candidatus Phycosocius bacilliformis TaxID=1445552 RepID=A0A2P2EBE6_9PROT|nr:aminotransferase class V-fold PLP-dependent enzyme [Candidatus Phycosocius bacilliformis]GBF58369.1 cysteine desulfurase IscS [Candidatus Phycosocius bacilliformis]
MTSRLYADHNATTPLRPEARAAMLEALDVGGNPSSVHGEGRRAKRLLEDARESLAKVLECQAEAITLTSGATEALHLCLESAKAMGFGPVFISAVEHDAVWTYAARLWPEAQIIPVNRGGLVDVAWLSGELDNQRGQPLVIVQGANNEVGTLQPLNLISTKVRAVGGALLCDGVQLLGKVSVGQFAGLADWLVVSSHKIGGPGGAGALISAPGIDVVNHRSGGGQERGGRSGTENIAAIAGFAAAARAACGDDAVLDFQRLTSEARHGFELAVATALPEVEFVGHQVRRLANTSCIVVEGWEGAAQVMALDLAGAAISAGSACSSGKVKMSRVLKAAGFSDLAATSAIRASFGWSSQVEDGARLADLYLKAAARAGRPLSSQAA